MPRTDSSLVSKDRLPTYNFTSSRPCGLKEPIPPGPNPRPPPAAPPPRPPSAPGPSPRGLLSLTRMVRPSN